MRRKSVFSLLTFALVLLLAACGGGGSDDTKGRSTTDASEQSERTEPASDESEAKPLEPALEAYDPPKQFAKTGADVPSDGGVSSETAVLRGETLYVATREQLIAFDATPAERAIEVEESWSVAIKGTPPQSSDPRAPVVSDDGKAVYAAFPITVPGSGTTPAHQAVEVLAVDAESGQTFWTTQVDVPKEVADDQVSSADARVVGATDKAVVIGYYAGIPFTVAIDPSTQKPTWSLKDLAPVSVHGDVVVGGVGTQYGLDRGVQQLKGVGVADGKDRWMVEAGADKEWDRFIPQVASPSLIALDRSGSDPANEYTPFSDLTFLDPATGSVVATVPVADGWQAVECDYDGKSVSVCTWSTSLGDLSVGAYDAKSGAALWELTKGVSDRLAPQVTALFHGALYGTTDNGPVVLDARTGVDISATVSVAPVLVSEFAGLADGALHAATG